MVTKKILASTFIATFISSCGIFGDDIYDKKALTYKNQFVFDNQFRMDGMYIMKDQYGCRLHYFFQNGSYYAVGIDDPNSNCNFNECKNIHQKERDIPYYWGYYIIENNTIKVQTFEANRSNNFNFKFRVRERWAEIVNDTTLHFFKAIDPDKKERSLDETFHFQYCSNKPDSTNILMKD